MYIVQNSTKAHDKNTDLPLNPFEEVVGIFNSATEHSITLFCTKKVTLEIGSENVERFRHILSKGASVAVLKMHDGSVRIRPIRQDLEGTITQSENVMEVD